MSWQQLISFLGIQETFSDGSDLQWSPNPAAWTLQSWSSESMLLQAFSKCLLNTDRFLIPITSQWSLFQDLTTPLVKKHFLMSGLDLSCCSFEPFPWSLGIREKRWTPPYPLLCQDAVDTNEVTAVPPFLQTRQVQNPGLLLMGHSFQPFHDLCCAPLITFNYLDILLKFWHPEQHSISKVRPHQYRGIIASLDQLSPLKLVTSAIF